MEIRIIIFLAFVSVTLITNTLIILFAYRALAGITTKFTSAVADLQASGETRELIKALQFASERAASVTETARVKVAAFDSSLGRFQEDFQRNLTATDSKLENIADNLDRTARNVRDMISKPAFAAASFSAGFIRVLRER